MTPTGVPVDAGEADDEVARPARGELEQRAAVDQPRGDVAHVVDRALALGQRSRRDRRGPGRAGGYSGSGPPAVDGRWASALAHELGGVHVVARRTRCATPLRPWTFGPPSSSRRDPLARDALDDRRAR